MKVYLQSVNDFDGRYIGEVPPNRMMEVLEEVRKMSVWSEKHAGFCTEFSTRIIYDEDEAVLVIQLDGWEKV